MTEKRCNGCFEILPISMFQTSKRDKFASRCKPCIKKQTKATYAKNKLDPKWVEERNAKHREYKRNNPRSYMRRRGEWLKYKYNMTLEDYDILLKSQNGVCAVCYEECKTKKGLAIDHDHKCCPGDKSCGKCIRGLLCSNCNGAIGMLKEDIEIFNRALAYIGYN